MSSLILRGLFIQKREGDLHTVTKAHFLSKNQIDENSQLKVNLGFSNKIEYF